MNLSWFSVFVAAGAAALAPAVAGAAMLEGEVVEIVRAHLLVRTTAGLEVVQVDPGATIIGVPGLDSLRTGDRVRATWSRQAGGVRAVSVVETDPSVGGGASLPASFVVTALAGPPAGRPVIVDVRTEGEFQAGHLPGALSVPLARISELKHLIPALGEGGAVFYGQRVTSREPIDAARSAAALGLKHVRWLEGGVQGWVGEGRALAIEPQALAKGMKPGPVVVIDVRARERALVGTIPGAVSLPRGEMKWESFIAGMTLPTIVFVGEDEADDRPLTAAEQLRLWHNGVPVRAIGPIRVLAGGWKAWQRGGRKVASGDAVARQLRIPAGVGEVERAEFSTLYRADPGPKGPLLLDVRLPGEPLPWGKAIPVDDLVARLGELPRDREIIAYCQIGKQSAVAHAILVRNGFRARYLNGNIPK